MSSTLRFALAVVVCVACSGPGEPSSGEQRGDPYLRCAPTRDDGLEESFKLPPLVIARDGHEVEIRGLERGVVVLGLMAGLSEPRPTTLANIAHFLDRFKAAGVQAIVVAGGVGLHEQEVEPLLQALAAAPVPVLISPGAQESFDVLRQTIARLRKRHPQLLDMTLVRRVRLGHITLISLPGYHKAFYLEAGERGCAYEEGDLGDVAALADRDRPTVLISASPPRGRGDRAVDRGRGGVNIGDPALARLLKERRIRFGLFGHVYESGGHATLADGESPLAEGVWQNSLFIQAGAVEAVPLSLVGGGRSVGMAQVVEFSGDRGRYRPVMARQPADR